MNHGGSQGGSSDGCIYLTQQTDWYECHSVRQTNHPNGLATGPFDVRDNHWHTFGSWHPGICQFVMADGAVRAVSNQIDLTTLANLGDRRDGNPINGDVFDSTVTRPFSNLRTEIRHDPKLQRTQALCSWQ